MKGGVWSGMTERRVGVLWRDMTNERCLVVGGVWMRMTERRVWSKVGQKDGCGLWRGVEGFGGRRMGRGGV